MERTNVVSGGALIGRAIDRAALASLFEEGARLVTIVGPGGMGKTRLATQFAVECTPAYAAHGGGGTWFCDCTAATGPADLCAAIAAVLGVKLDAGGDAPAPQLARALARRGPVLLVIDNFETIVASSANTLAHVAREAPEARFLVTSRIALGVPGEYLWPLQGLPLPPPPEAAPATAALLAAPAVDLFVRRARQLRPDLVLDDAATRAVAAIAARLDGIPLAIELAASRVVALSPQQILERLGTDRELLARRTDTGRHGSMLAVVSDSLRLLGERERRCLAGSTVFAGGFTLDAASDVLLEGAPALAAIEMLVAHSMLRVAPGPEPRFFPYEVIREVMEAELEAEPELRQRVRRRHRAHFVRWLDGADRARHAVERHNLARAHASALEDESALPDAIALALALAPVLASQGLLARSRELFDATVLRARMLGQTGTEAFRELLVARARNAVQLGAHEPASQDLEEALARAEGPLERARIHVLLGTIVETRGDTEGAREQLLAALESAAREPTASGRELEAEARAAVAHTYRREGRLDEAEREIAASLALYRGLGDAAGLSTFALCVHEAGVIALFRQQYAVAIGRFDEALALARSLGARPREAAVLTARGTLEQELGNVDAARELHEGAVAIFRELGMAYSEASTLYYLAGAYLESGRSADGEAVLSAALRLVRSVGVPRYEALMLGALAASRARVGATAEARRLLDWADALADACRTEAPLLATLAIHRLQLQAIDASTLDQGAAIAARHACDDPRFALRLLALPRGDVPTAALLVRHDGSAFRLPGEDTDVDLRKRGALGRVLLALARARVDSPNEVLRVSDILTAAWPGERVRYEAGANRVYVALAELRKLGLREWIVTENGGYRLSTSRAAVLERPRG